MESLPIFIIIASVVLIGGLGALAYGILGGSGASGKTNKVRELMAASETASPQRRQTGRRGQTVDPLDLEASDIRKVNSQSKAKSKSDDISSKLFKAGFFTAADRRRFLRFRITSFVICLFAVPIMMALMTAKMNLILVAIFLGALIGFSVPMSWLEKQIRRREDDILYYLPLVVEQVSIGVSSSLDIGPCVAHIVEMANERDSHNAVTEMFVHVEKLMRSGLSLEESLIEVGEANGTTEVKHAFMFLAQCARHGGEVSKQLQELADSVMTQRQVHIEGKIAALPVKATGPLGVVFAGFFALLFAGLFVRILSAFGG